MACAPMHERPSRQRSKTTSASGAAGFRAAIAMHASAPSPPPACRRRSTASLPLASLEEGMRAWVRVRVRVRVG